MDKNKAQKVAVLTSFRPEDKMLILNGIKIATVFKKELCLVYNSKKKSQKQSSTFKTRLLQYAEPIKNEIPTLKISTLITSSSISDLSLLLADDYEVIYIITESDSFKRYSKAVLRSPVPFLFVNEKAEVSDFNKVILPMDLRSGNSDSALWCTYFGRFNNADLVVVAANEKNKYNQKEVAKNVVLTKKLFQKFKIKHKIYKGQHSSWKITFEALEYANSSGSNLFVVLGSSSITPLDLLIGLPEGKIIKMAGEMPVMYINSRRNNYVLCD